MEIVTRHVEVNKEKITSITMANNPNPADQDSFKPISLVPNYRALELIQENRSEIDTIVAESQFFKSIATGEQYRNFKSTLYDVETYINQTNEGKVTWHCLFHVHTNVLLLSHR